MGRAIDALAEKLGKAERIRVRLTAEDEALIVELASLAGGGGGGGTYSSTGRTSERPTTSTTYLRKPSGSTATRTTSKSSSSSTSTKSSSKWTESLHPRNTDGTFAYKEDDGGTAGKGTKDKGLPNGKPDGKIHGRISEMQSILVKKGYLKSTDGHLGVAIDGYFGNYTEAALKEFQQRAKLKVTGTLNSETSDALGLKETVELSGTVELTKKGSLDWSPKENWVDQEGGLPTFIENMAIHMMENSGLTREHAIRASVVRTKVLAAKGNDRAIKALAQWEKMKASAHARKNKD